jgi:MFS family permease
MSRESSLVAAQRAVSAIFMLNGIAFANWATRIPQVRERLALDEGELGLALLGTAVGAMVSFRVAGPLIVRFGSRAITHVSSVLLCATLPLPALAPSYALLVAALLLLGMANGLMDVSMNAQAVEVERRAARPILSAFHGMFSLGGLIGAITGSLAARVEMSPSANLLLLAGILAVPAVLGGRVLLPDAPVAPRAPDAPRERRSMRLLLLGLVCFCSSVGEGAMADWSAVYLRDDLHTSASVAAIGYAAFSLAMLIGRFSGDWLTQRLGAVRIMRAAGLVVVAGLGAALLANVPAGMMIGFACVGAGLSVVVPLVFRAGTSIGDVSPGQALATLATMSYGGFLAGPPVIGFIADRFTLRVGLGVVAALAVVIVVFAQALERRPAVPHARPERGRGERLIERTADERSETA